MKSLIEPLVVSLFLAVLTLPSIVEAQTSSQALGSISTPDRHPSSLGTLDFKGRCAELRKLLQKSMATLI
jgi:hypothetical protein